MFFLDKLSKLEFKVIIIKLNLIMDIIPDIILHKCIDIKAIGMIMTYHKHIIVGYTMAVSCYENQLLVFKSNDITNKLVSSIIRIKIKC